jgi:hypothetical protein
VSIEIVGLREYQELIKAEKAKGFTFCGNEIHHFHRQFISMIDSIVDPVKEAILLDYLESFQEFPTNQGIYFCARTHGSVNREIWYVGKASNFRKRWKNHHKLQALKAIQEITVYCLSLDGYSCEEISKAERAYIDMLKPVFNDTSKPEKYLSVAS